MFKLDQFNRNGGQTPQELRDCIVCVSLDRRRRRRMTNFAQQQHAHTFYGNNTVDNITSFFLFCFVLSVASRKENTHPQRHIIMWFFLHARAKICFSVFFFIEVVFFVWFSVQDRSSGPLDRNAFVDHSYGQTRSVNTPLCPVRSGRWIVTENRRLSTAPRFF